MARPADVVFQVAASAALVGVFGYFITQSVRNRRVQPGLWMAIACLSIFWIEAPFDWSMYAEFGPGIKRLPAVGPFAATYKGLVWLAPGGYVLYFGIPTLIALWVVKRMRDRLPWSPPMQLLIVGLAIGAVWDVVFEIVGTRLALWRYARTAPGLTLWAGTKYQVPGYVFLAMGLTIMVLTYLAGRRTDTGVTVVEAWVAARVQSPGRRIAATAFVFIGAMHLVYGLEMAPHYIAKVEGWQTTTSTTPLYGDIPLQPR